MILDRTGAGQRSISAELRSRYWPKSRICQSLVGVAPWLNVALLMLFFVFIDRNLVLQPGEVVALPVAQFHSGTRSQFKLIVRSVARPGTELRKEVVYFSDQRFLVAEQSQMESLRGSLAGRVSFDGESDLVIFADSHVRMDTLVRLFNMASDIGVKRVEVATRPGR